MVSLGLVLLGVGLVRRRQQLGGRLLQRLVVGGLKRGQQRLGSLDVLGGVGGGFVGLLGWRVFRLHGRVGATELGCGPGFLPLQALRVG